MLKVLRQTLHIIYILNICYLQTTYIFLKYKKKFIVSFTFIHIGKLFTLCTHLHSKGNSVLSYHLFRKTIIHTLLGIPCSLYLPTYTYYCKAFSTLPLCKVSIMGQPKFEQKLSLANPNFHIFLILKKPNFGFLAISMFPWIEATSLGS